MYQAPTLMLLLALQSTVGAAAGCGDVFDTNIGPFDYSDPSYHSPNGSVGMLRTVEKAHFTPRVEQLIGGQSTSVMMADIAYTLGKFPNHHRALYSLIKYDKRLGGRLPQTGKSFEQSVECYFQRALQFRPADGNTLQLYGLYHHLNGRHEQARDAYLAAVRYLDSAQVHYNLGLVYLELGNLEQAAEHARRAYTLGHPLPGLRNKLAERGVELAGP
jgi:tetratricopeptide (TPR) repeat protein